ncbi:hypothetical protein [Phytoactinopolyspora limicola]|uniref:hypothetical protein n=1 Tax=Phytoactinopolyspora limicola TaxID=2715536 RepID=UPI00140959D7|nr:hypothetical protein [Phytoactinopolyspora limicola]
MRNRRRAEQEEAAGVPVVLPQLIVQPTTEPGAYTITLDGQPVSVEPVLRNYLGRAVASVVEQAETAVRVEVHDPDGGIYADIVHPPPRRRPALEPSSRRCPDDVGCATRYDGFLPGERVLVTVVDRVEHADPGGHLEFCVDLCRTDDRDVVLVGSKSGTIILTEGCARAETAVTGRYSARGGQLIREL